jgi:hypothetical protein
MSGDRHHAREAAVTLLKMAKVISDPKIAAGLIEAAADLKDKAGELPPTNIEALTRLPARIPTTN